MGRLNFDHAPALGVPTAAATNVGNQAASTEFVQNVVPPGVVFPYAGPIPPAGWLLADGSAVSRTTYARLFAAIGTTYGVGDGTTTFNLPDLRGEFIRGLSNGRAGVDAGRALGTAQADEMRLHNHKYNDQGGGTYMDRGTAVTTVDGEDVTTSNVNFSVNTLANGSYTPTAVVSTGGAETRPRNVAMNFIIKAQ